ncbi:hypothetical protein [Nocardia sp. BMG111209]|uniref:hypothetical protein n=1 Tax=Nocardia sp. BMG111209 TaxID=1160137 RepID=UPI00036ACB08|nr:hypothetical protein [Nocardia sp. BMG111209]
MKQSTSLSRVRRSATGVFVAATIAAGGITVALAVDGNHAGATAQTEVAPADSARTAQPVDDSPAPGDTDDGWSPTTPVTTTPAAPHEHTTGS